MKSRRPIPDQMTTSKSPSSTRASGATCIPPPKKRPLQTEKEVIRASLQGPPSTRQRTGRSDQARSAFAEATMKESRPSPSFRPRFTSPATTPASPNPATFAKWRTWAVPSCAENSIRPRSQTSSRRPASERTAPSRSSGIPSVRRRSPPVPRGMKPKSGSGSRGWAAARPSITSLAVPSPPTATTSAPPERTASRASRTPSPGSFVKAHSNSPTADRTARAIRSKWRPVRPAALRGLTMRYGFTVVKDNRAWRSRPRPPSSPREHGEPAPAHVGSPRGPEFLGLWCMRAGCARLDPAQARNTFVACSGVRARGQSPGAVDTRLLGRTPSLRPVRAAARGAARAGGDRAPPRRHEMARSGDRRRHRARPRARLAPLRPRPLRVLRLGPDRRRGTRAAPVAQPGGRAPHLGHPRERRAPRGGAPQLRLVREGRGRAVRVLDGRARHDRGGGAHRRRERRLEGRLGAAPAVRRQERGGRRRPELLLGPHLVRVRARHLRGDHRHAPRLPERAVDVGGRHGGRDRGRLPADRGGRALAHRRRRGRGDRRARRVRGAVDLPPRPADAALVRPRPERGGPRAPVLEAAGERESAAATERHRQQRDARGRVAP